MGYIRGLKLTIHVLHIIISCTPTLAPHLCNLSSSPKGEMQTKGRFYHIMPSNFDVRVEVCMCHLYVPYRRLRLYDYNELQQTRQVCYVKCRQFMPTCTYYNPDSKFEEQILYIQWFDRAELFFEKGLMLYNRIDQTLRDPDNPYAKCSKNTNICSFLDTLVVTPHNCPRIFPCSGISMHQIQVSSWKDKEEDIKGHQTYRVSSSSDDDRYDMVDLGRFAYTCDTTKISESMFGRFYRSLDNATQLGDEPPYVPQQYLRDKHQCDQIRHNYTKESLSVVFPGNIDNYGVGLWLEGVCMNISNRQEKLILMPYNGTFFTFERDEVPLKLPPFKVIKGGVLRHNVQPYIYEGEPVVDVSPLMVPLECTNGFYYNARVLVYDQAPEYSNSDIELTTSLHGEFLSSDVPGNINHYSTTISTGHSSETKTQTTLPTSSSSAQTPETTITIVQEGEDQLTYIGWLVDHKINPFFIGLICGLLSSFIILIIAMYIE